VDAPVIGDNHGLVLALFHGSPPWVKGERAILSLAPFICVCQALSKISLCYYLNMNTFEGEQHYVSKEFSPDERRVIVHLILKNEKEPRPKQEDFAGVFSQEEIIRDQTDLKRIQSIIANRLEHLPSEDRKRIEDGKQRSDALEVIVGDQVELNDWFGPNAVVTRTTEFDDFMHGVDAVVEFNLGDDEHPEIIVLVIDASMRADVQTVDGKIKRNINRVAGGEEPTMVKYFRSQIQGPDGKVFEGSLENVVPVVIGLDGENCDKLMGTFAQLVKLRRNKERTDAIKSLTHEKMLEMQAHPAQRVFLEEMKIQLEMYAELLERKHPDTRHSVYKEKVAKVLAIVNEILELKQDIELGELEKDGIFEMIRGVVVENRKSGQLLSS
jgi:hypothetical protein